MKNKRRIQFHLFTAIGIVLIIVGSCKKEVTTVPKDPLITWSNPADITAGTLLSATQLNATADVVGTFVYTPAIGTSLSVGADQVLKVDFTPSDVTAYNLASKTVKVNVITTSFNIQTALIPAGTFTMGSPINEVGRNDDETQHVVTLSAFKMSKYEITNAQYATFLNAKSIGSDGLYAAGAYPTKALIYASNNEIYDFGLNYDNSQWVPAAGYENNPVINVTWYGAAEFATYVGGRLPTEAEWEYACRAGTTTPFSTGNCLTDAQANYDWAYPYSTCTNTNTTRQGKTHNVGTYEANAFGLFDMHGNVWEWCSDWYGKYSDTAQTNPTGVAIGSGRVFRGGSWLNYAILCRSANRAGNSPSSSGSSSVGFRVVFAP